MTQPILKLEGIEKSFGKNNVLRGVDIDVAPGQSLVVIGGSGSGKSVMLKVALGLMTPTGGKVLFDGHDVTNSTGKTPSQPIFFQATEVIGMQDHKLHKLFLGDRKRFTP